MAAKKKVEAVAVVRGPAKFIGKTIRLRDLDGDPVTPNGTDCLLVDVYEDWLEVEVEGRTILLNSKCVGILGYAPEGEVHAD